MTREHETLLIGYVRRAIDGAARCGLDPVDLAFTMLAVSAAIIRESEGAEAFIDVMERVTSRTDDGMAEFEHKGRAN